MNRGTFEDPTQMIDSLEQLHAGGHLKTLFPVFPNGARYNTSADIITTVRMLFVRLACVNPEKIAVVTRHPPCSMKCSTEEPDISSSAAELLSRLIYLLGRPITVDDG